MSSAHTAEIEKRLKAVRSKIRRVQHLRAWLLVGAVFLGGLLIAMLTDVVFAPLPTLARWGIFGIWMGSIAWALKAGFGPVFQQIRLLRIARWLEERHPEIEERISTALEISGNKGVSPELLHALLEAADKDAGQMDPNLEVVAGSSTKKWRRAVIGCAAVIAIALVITPASTTRLLIRAVAPFSSVGNAGATNFELAPGDLEVLEGDAVEITVKYAGKEIPELVLELENGARLTQPLVKGEDAWHYRVEPARETFQYHAVAGQAVSDGYTAKVLPLPRLIETRQTLTFPSYTGLLPEEHALESPVEAVVGTTLRIEGQLNTPVESAWLDLNGKRRAEGEVEASASGGRAVWEFEFKAGESGEVVIWSHHRLGRDLELARFEIRALEDVSPQVVLLSPTRREIKVRPDEHLDLRYEVTDDFGLATVLIEAESGKRGGIEIPQILPERVARSEPPRYRGSARVSVGGLLDQFKGAREFHLRVRAEDARPKESGGPGHGASEWLIVRIDRSAESLARQKLFAEHDDAKKTLEEAMRVTREAEQKMHQNRGQLEQATNSEQSQKLTRETQKKLADAKEALEQLASRMEEGIHAAKADEVRKASEMVQETLENFEKVPLLDERQERHEQLDESIEDAREAVKKMEEIRREIDRERPQVEDLAKMEELAQRQEELARQAEQTAMQDPSAQTPKDWQQQQQQMEDQLRAEMHQRPEALAEALQQQAEQTETLASDAREVEKAQSELESIAQKLASAEVPENSTAEQLRSALAEEQKKLSEDAGEEAQAAAENQSAAAEDAKLGSEEAKAAAQELARNQLPDAADSAQKAAEAMQEAAAEAQASAEHAMTEADSSEAGSPEAGSEEATSETGSPESDQPGSPETGEPQMAEANASESGSPDQAQAEAAEEAAQAEQMTELADRQETIAEAARALAEGNLEEAASKLSDAQAASAESMAEAVQGMLAQEQAAIAHEAREQLAEARQERSALADVLPEAAAAAQDAKESFEQSSPTEAAQQASEAATSIAKAATEASQVAQDAAETGTSEGATEAAATSQEMAQLTERQEQVAEAAQALAEGEVQEALGQLQAMNAEQASALAQEIGAIPQLAGSQLGQAANQAQQGSQQAQQASQQSAEGQMPQAATANAQAARSFGEAAKSLEQASAQLAAAAAKAAERKTPSHQAPIGAEAMAEAFQQAGQAAESPSAAQAAQSAAQAAKALSQTAQQGRQAMQGQPGMPGQPNQPGPPGEPGLDPTDGPRTAEADPGVPPELAKLGISADDWEKIQASLRSDVGAGGDTGVPEDYRRLVKDYFQSMTEK